MKKKISIILLFLMFCTYVFAQKMTSGLLERSQLDEKYKWDTRDIYENGHAWERDYIWIEENLLLYKKYKGKLNESAESLYDCLCFDDKIRIRLRYVWLYAKLHKDVDMRNTKFQKWWGQYSLLETKVAAARAFIQREVIFIPHEKIQKFMADKSELKIYSHFFYSMQSKKKHMLSQKNEDILLKTARLIENPYAVFGTFVYAELPFPTIKNDKGENIKLNRSMTWRARSSPDRSYRKRGYNEYYASLRKFKGTLTKNLNGFIDGKVLKAEIRNYKNSLEASLSKDHIPETIYHNLIESVKKSLKPVHRWMAMKKKWLGLDTLQIYDTRVSMFETVEKEYSWEEGRELTFESLKSLGDEFLTPIKKAYTHRWIDAYPNLGKETGGYSSGPFGPHPYVKMNWGGKLFDFYTLVHELGHYVHAVKTMENQPFVYREYPSFLAEVASTTAENISQFYLIQNSKSKNEKLYHIEKYLDNIFLNVYNSTMMAEFERELYRKVESGEILSADSLSELYGQLCAVYYGKDVTIEEIDKYSWLEWPHYYLDYYLYSYATSFSASIQISESILTEGKPALDRFNTFLQAGNSDYPVRLLKIAGVDITTMQPYNTVANKMNKMMDEMEFILNQ